MQTRVSEEGALHTPPKAKLGSNFVMRSKKTFFFENQIVNKVLILYVL
jgi:hypothetical protein